MRYFGALIVSFVHLFSLSQVTRATDNMDSKAVSSAIAKFSARFCNELEKNKSFVASPLSAEYLLALLALGTSEPAHGELLQTLGIPDDDSIRKSIKSVVQNKSMKGVTLNIANKVFVKDGEYDLHPELKKDAVEVFDADIEKMNFGNGAAAAHKINSWVESKTNSRIKDLLSSDCLNDDTRLVLVNALYFKGTWAKQFDPAHTQPRPFHIDSKTVKDVPMMYKEANYNYGESQGLNAQLLEIDYVGKEASMLVILPREVEGLNNLLKTLAAGYDLNDELDNMHSVKVQVSLPKFKIETEIDLSIVLPKLGIKAIFNPENSGLTKVLNANEPLYVSKAVQKAFIEVNEEGAEAAAATAGVIRKRRALQVESIRTFAADRPALWCIMVGRQVLFEASYCPPKNGHDEL